MILKKDVSVCVFEVCMCIKRRQRREEEGREKREVQDTDRGRGGTQGGRETDWDEQTECINGWVKTIQQRGIHFYLYF